MTAFGHRSKRAELPTLGRFLPTHDRVPSVRISPHGRPGALEDAVDVARRALEQDTEIGALGNEPAGLNVYSIRVDGRQPAPGHRRHYCVSPGQQESVGGD